MAKRKPYRASASPIKHGMNEEKTSIVARTTRLFFDFCKASFLACVFVIFSLPFLQAVDTLSEEEKASIGGENILVMALVYLCCSLATIFYLDRKKAPRTIGGFLMVFFIGGAILFGWRVADDPSFIGGDILRDIAQEEGGTTEKQVTLPEATGEKTVEYRWKYKGKEYALTTLLYSSYYDVYTSLPTYTPYTGQSDTEWSIESNALMMTPIGEDRTVSELAARLVALGQEKKFTENQMVEFVTAFVQNIPYDQEKLDRRNSGLNGPMEKPTYPYEVLFDGKGVCQDKSYLAYMLLRELGYGVAIFHFPRPEDNHMAVGIRCPREHANYDSGYCFVETTNPGNKIGMIPDLVPQTRVARADIELVESAGSSSEEKEEAYQPLGEVNILNEIEGKEYTGIVDTIATQKELERLRRFTDAEAAKLKVIDKEITAYEEALDAMEKKLKKLAKGDDWDEYADYYEKYSKKFSQYKKVIKSYNAVVESRNAAIKKYNALNRAFYQDYKE